MDKYNETKIWIIKTNAVKIFWCVNERDRVNIYREIDSKFKYENFMVNVYGSKDVMKDVITYMQY